MSAIPPNLVGPLMQSSLVQGQVSAVRDSENAHRASSERRLTGAILEADSTVETTDSDTQVFTDAEGGGSQGRAFSEPDDQQSAPDAVRDSLDGGDHIDLTA